MRDMRYAPQHNITNEQETATNNTKRKKEEQQINNRTNGFDFFAFS